MLKGRLGLETARVPHRDRHGLIWLERGELSVIHGTLVFKAAASPSMEAGRYDLPYQSISCVLIGPGTTVTHDALRLLARHGTGLVAMGTEGVRHYASMPQGPDRSALARAQVRRWSDARARIRVTLKMYEIRLGEQLPSTDLNALRGIEGARVKESYRLLAQKHGVPWGGRRYDRSRPDSNDDVNNALNHASTAVVACAQVAVAASGAIPQLGFIHETSGIAFALDIADLYREKVTLPCAFRGLGDARSREDQERAVRHEVARTLRRERVVSDMIDRIKELLDGDDGGGDA